MTTINKNVNDVISAIQGEFKPIKNADKSVLRYRVKLVRGSNEYFLTGASGTLDGFIVIDANQNKYIVEESDIIYGLD
jgi:hypothetical protein